MRIQPVVSHTAFKGLLSTEEHFNQHQTLYGGEYECDYYDRVYYPFADESTDEARSNMNRLEQEINKTPDLSSCSGIYVSVKLGHPLTLTKADYNALLKQEATKHLRKL